MPLPQNHGPCSVNNCDINTKFRRFTKLAYEKAQKKGTFNIFNYLKIGDQLCQTHYNNIVEPDRNKCENIPLNDLSTFNTNTNVINDQINKGMIYYIFYFINEFI